MLLRKLKNSNKKWKKGFTLVELLVAIAIMTILSLSVALITTSASRTFSKGSQTIAADDVKDLSLAVIKQKIYACNDIVLQRAPYDEANSATIDSELLKTHHALFFYNGRLYLLPSNPDGLVEIDLEGNKLPIGTQEIIEDNAYDRYKSQFSITPIKNVRKDKYLSICIKVYVYDKNLNLMSSGQETINLLNVEKNETEVQFDDENTNFVCYFY